MGIDLYCTNKYCDEQFKLCSGYKRELLDALREYLVANKTTNSVELNYINWLYREEEKDSDVYNLTEKERKEGVEGLKKKKLYGIFFYIGLCDYSTITYDDAILFINSFKKVKAYMKDDNFLDISIFEHVIEKKHELRCY